MKISKLSQDGKEWRREEIIIWKGVFWVIDGEVVSVRVRCDESGTLIMDEDTGYLSVTVKRSELLQLAETWSNNHKKIWFTLPRTITHGKAYNYFPRGRVEIRKKKAIIFLNPCLCYEEMIRKIKKEFGLERNTALRDILVKADGSSHYRCYAEKGLDE